MTSNTTVLRCERLVKEYQVGPEPIRILDELEFHLSQGDWVSVVGASGSGKTTLLNMLAGLDTPSSGRVMWGEQDISTLSEAKLGKLRNAHLGFVYQFHHLLAEFSACENVAMPLWIQGMNKKQALMQAKSMLEKVGLASRFEHKPAELSGGERQRVAIARALIAQPALVLLDEPTGNLDAHTAHDIQQLITKLNKEMNTAFVVVTHDIAFSRLAQTSYELLDGKLQSLNALA
jgi:lipoprotein-releasing system ATP-binding protein